MRLSHERCVHLSHLFVNALEDEDSVDFLLDPNDVRLRVLQILESELVKDHRSNPNMVVSLRADESCRWKDVAAVLDRCQRNGISRISPKTDPSKRP